jgi:hypothetical protein
MAVHDKVKIKLQVRLNIYYTTVSVTKAAEG